MIRTQLENLKNYLEHVLIFLLLEDNVERTEVLICHDVIGQARILLPISLTTTQLGGSCAKVGRVCQIALLYRWTSEHLIDSISDCIGNVHPHHFILELTAADRLIINEVKKINKMFKLIREMKGKLIS